MEKRRAERELQLQREAEAALQRQLAACVCLLACRFAASVDTR
jgi:hypothetical protein